jgi:hypothetical protein
VFITGRETFFYSFLLCSPIQEAGTWPYCTCYAGGLTFDPWHSVLQACCHYCTEFCLLLGSQCCSLGLWNCSEPHDRNCRQHNAHRLMTETEGLAVQPHCESPCGHEAPVFLNVRHWLEKRASNHGQTTLLLRKHCPVRTGQKSLVVQPKAQTIYWLSYLPLTSPQTP